MLLKCSRGENSFFNYSYSRQDIENILCVTHIHTLHTLYTVSYSYICRSYNATRTTDKDRQRHSVQRVLCVSMLEYGVNKYYGAILDFFLQDQRQPTNQEAQQQSIITNNDVSETLRVRLSTVPLNSRWRYDQFELHNIMNPRSLIHWWNYTRGYLLCNLSSLSAPLVDNRRTTVLND